MVSLAAQRMPPLDGPRASLCWTRNPLKTLKAPSFMRTGMRKWNSRSGQRSMERIPVVETELVADLVELLLRHLEGVDGGHWLSP